MNQKLSSKLKSDTYSKLTVVLLYAVVITVPLAVYPGALDQALSIKYLLLKIIALFLVSLFIHKMAANGAKIMMSGLELPIIVLLFLLLTATLLSVNPRTSFNGAFLRYDGLISHLIYFTLFFFSVQHLRNKHRFDVFITISVLTATVVSIYGIMQRFGIDPISWGYYVFEVDRSFATFGNPIMLGAYLSLMLPQSIGLLQNSKSVTHKIAFSVTTIAIFLCLIMTMSRAAWLAALLGIAVMGVVFIKKRGVNQKASLMPVVAVLSIALISVFSIGMPIFVSRLLSIFSLSGSVSSRLLMWKAALQMVLDRPLFGFGPDALRYAFSKYETIELARMAPLETQDNVHNAFLQLATGAGIPALLAFISIIVIVLAKTAKHISSEEQVSPVVIGVLAGVIAFIAQSITGVTGIATSTFLWLSIGSLASSWAGEEINIKPVGGRLRYIIATIIAVTFIVGLLNATKPFLSDIALGQARVAEQSGDIRLAEKLYKEAIYYNPADDKAYGEFGIMLADLGGAFEDGDLWYKGIALLSESVRLTPDDHANLTLLAQGYLYGARIFDKAYYPNAEKYLIKALEAKPYSSSAKAMLGTVYLETRRLSESKGMLSSAIDIHPNNAQAHYYLGRYYEGAGQKDDALREYKATLSIDADHKRAKAAYERMNVNADK